MFTFSAANDLLHRLTSPNPTRPFVFLVGAPLTAGKDGVPDVKGMCDLLIAELGRDVAEEVLERAEIGREYQELMAKLAARHGAAGADRLIRAAVLRAWKGPAADVDDLAGLRMLETRTEWHLSEGVRALGQLLCLRDVRFPPVVLTTNFDPLIEVAIRAAGGTPYHLVLDRDGSFADPPPGDLVHVVHLCGHWTEGHTLHVQSQLQAPRPQLADALLTLLRGRTLVALAYSGWEDAIALAIKHALTVRGTPLDVAWTFYEKRSRKILKESAELLERLEPAIGGAAQLYSDVNVHTFLPDLRQRLGAPRARPAPAVGKDAWSAAVLTSGLLPQDEGDPLRLAAGRLVARLWPFWESRNSIGDGWCRPELSERIMRSAELLLSAGPTLHRGERAILAVAPFVREAVLAAGAVALAGVGVECFEEDPKPSSLRRALEAEHRSRQNVLRRARWLRDSGRPDDARALAWWLGHRALLRRKLLWMPSTERDGELPDALFAAMAPDSADSLVKEALDSARLLRVARGVSSSERHLANGSETLRSYDDAAAIGSAPRTEPVREVLLARVLHLAGWLALDPRHLDEVVADQVGADPALEPPALADTLQGFKWERDAGRHCVALRGRSAHAAIDLAVRRHVEAAELARERLVREDSRLTSLNERLMVESLEPTRKPSGELTWTRPHLRFELAPTEVRELLMGEQLYGEAAVAIRELYQNALDALRYRQARQRYLEQRGDLPRPDQEWEGKIHFVQEQSFQSLRVSCQDNGVGMGIEELMGAFARAGRRFRDLPAYAEEEAEWLGCKEPIRVYPNSQFGVGVLSYFMLADEVIVETTRYQRDGTLGPELTVRIGGPGALFHVTVTRPQGREAGTKVTLVLSTERARDNAPSLVDTLERWLVVAEFHTEAREGSRGVIWGAGQLRGYPGAVAIPGADPQSWFVPERGAILADGLRVDQVERYDQGPATSTPAGAVVNLTGRFRPRLSVDRRVLLGWNPDSTEPALTAGAGIGSRATFVTVAWLAGLAGTWPRSADRLAGRLAEREADIPIATGADLVPVARVGFDPLDRVLFGLGKMKAYSNESSLSVSDVAMRLDRWRDAAHLLPPAVRELLPFLPALGSQICSPSDAAVSSIFRSFDAGALEGLLMTAGATRLPIGVALGALRRMGIDPAPGAPVEALSTLRLGYSWARALITLTEDPATPRRRLGRLESPVAPGRLVATAMTLKCPLSEVVAKVRSLAPLGIATGGDYNSPVPVLEPGDRVALSGARGSWIVGSVGIGQIYTAAAALNERPSDTWRRLARYRCLGLDICTYPLETLDALSPDEATCRILAFVAQDGVLTATGLWRAACNFARSPSQIVHVLSPYMALGIKIHADLESLDVLPRTVEDLRVYDNWRARGIGGVANAFDIDGGSTAERLERLIGLADLDPEIGAWAARWEAFDEETRSEALRRSTIGVSLLLTGGPPPRAVVDACRHLGISLPFRAKWPNTKLDYRTLQMISRDIDANVPWLSGAVSHFEIAFRALRLGIPYEEALSRLQSVAPYADITIKPPPK